MEIPEDCGSKRWRFVPDTLDSFSLSLVNPADHNGIRYGQEFPKGSHRFFHPYYGAKVRMDGRICGLVHDGDNVLLFRSDGLEPQVFCSIIDRRFERS